MDGKMHEQSEVEAQAGMPAEPLTREQIQAAQQANADAGRAEIEEICERRGLELIGVPKFTQDGRVVASVAVVGK